MAPFNVFRHCETFLWKYKLSPKGFLIFCNKRSVKKFVRVPFENFGTFRLFQTSQFCLILGFVNIYLISFFQNYPNFFNLISEVKRFIRTFDVISELFCVLLRRRRMFEKIRSFSWKRPTHLSKLRFLSLRYSAYFRRSRSFTTVSRICVQFWMVAKILKVREKRWKMVKRTECCISYAHCNFCSFIGSFPW